MKAKVRRANRIFLVSAFLLAQVSLVSPTAEASSHYAFSWSFTTAQVTAGTPVPASYTFNGLPKGSVVNFERGFGTTNFLRSVARYSVAGSGSAQVSLPSVPEGLYSYKAIVSTATGRVLLQSSLKSLYSYNTVPFSNICNSPKASVGGSGCELETVEVGANLFTYDLRGNYDQDSPPSYATLIMFPATTCRGITLNFALDDNNSQAGDIAYIQIIQTTLDPEQASTPQGTVGTLAANLDGGPWYLQVSATNGDSVFINGSASCWTASGTH